MTSETLAWGVIAAAAWAVKVFPHALLATVAAVAYWYGKRRRRD